jgi:hypothetical protein
MGQDLAWLANDGRSLEHGVSFLRFAYLEGQENLGLMKIVEAVAVVKCNFSRRL